MSLYWSIILSIKRILSTVSSKLSATILQKVLHTLDVYDYLCHTLSLVSVVALIKMLLIQIHRKNQPKPEFVWFLNINEPPFHLD